MKKFLIFSVLVLQMSSLYSQSNMVDGVVWIIGDQAIFKSEVEEQRIRLQMEGSRIEGNPYCIIPEQLAIQKLFLHQAKIDSVVVNEGQVESQVNMRVNDFLSKIGSKEKLEEYYGKPLNEIKEDMRTIMREQMAIQEVQQKISSAIKVTPSDVRLFYNSLPEDSIPVIPASVEVQILTLEPAISLAEREATKERLREFAERVNSGNADFSVLARLYSDDTESAKLGGDLGFFGRGVMVPEFTNVAFGLQEVGKVSRVVETEFGYHIIQLVERRNDRVRCRHILLRPRVSSEVKIETFDRLDSINNLIRTSKLVFEQAVTIYSSDKNTRLNSGLMSNPNTSASRFEYQDLPPEIAKQVYSMKVGDISEPFTMIDQTLGREVYAVVKLKSKLDNHKANMTDDYQALKAFCENVKRNEVLEKWIADKIKETYIYIDPLWQDCDFQFQGWIK